MRKTKNIKDWKLNGIRSFLNYGFLQENIVLAGGSLRSLIDPLEPIQDYDLFFLGENPLSLKEDIENKIKKLSGKKTFQCDLDELRSFTLHGMKIQLIETQKKYSTPQELILDFDINACIFALHQGELFFRKQSIKDIKKKHITINKVTYPIATLKRISKYQSKGYKITLAAAEFVKQVAENSLDMDLDRVYID